jgi:hypothetical protein
LLDARLCAHSEVRMNYEKIPWQGVILSTRLKMCVRGLKEAEISQIKTTLAASFCLRAHAFDG